MNYRINFKPTEYKGASCYPVLICQDSEYFREKNLSEDVTFEIAHLLANNFYPDPFIFYLQREYFGFQLCAVTEKQAIRIDDDGEIYINENRVRVKADTLHFEQRAFSASVVLCTIDRIFTVPRMEIGPRMEQHIDEDDEIFFEFLENFSIPFPASTRFFSEDLFNSADVLNSSTYCTATSSSNLKVGKPRVKMKLHH